MKTESEASVWQKIGIVAVLIGFVAIGGFFGHLFYQCMEIFGRVHDLTTHIVAISVGAVLAGGLAYLAIRLGVGKTREAISSSGVDPSDMSFMSLVILSTMAGDSGGGTGGSDISSGGTDWTGGGVGGGDFGGGHDHSGGGHFSGGDAGFF